MEFLEFKNLELNKAGYLISKTSKKPVKHDAFVQEQKTAEYIVKLAEAIKGKTFKTGKLDDLEAIKAEVLASIKNTSKKYVDEPTKPTSKANDELVKFALDFVAYEDSKLTVGKINEIMNQFNTINDVCTVGEYFSEGVVKLNKLYSISDILEAVKTNVETLD